MLWRFLKKLKIGLPYNPAIPLLGIYPKEMKSVPQRDCCAPLFIAALFIIAKIWKQPVSINGWMDKEMVVYTTKYYSAFKKEILPFATTWMDLQDSVLSEISQTKKEKYRRTSFMFFLIYFFFLATLRGLQDLSSPTRDRTRAPCSGSAES